MPRTGISGTCTFPFVYWGREFAASRSYMYVTPYYGLQGTCNVSNTLDEMGCICNTKLRRNWAYNVVIQDPILVRVVNYQ